MLVPEGRYSLIEKVNSHPDCLSSQLEDKQSLSSQLYSYVGKFFQRDEIVQSTTLFLINKKIGVRQVFGI